MEKLRLKQEKNTSEDKLLTSYAVKCVFNIYLICSFNGRIFCF
jgi:hypothetical protein